MRRLLLALPLLFTARAASADVTTGRANGASYVHLLGKHAGITLAPNTGTVGALVAVPKGQRPADYGLEEVAPGIGRLRAVPAKIEDFGFAHPDLRVEVFPPLHMLMNRVGQWVGSTRARTERGADGSGVLVGVADTGLDVTHPEMLDSAGNTRVAWMLDLSLSPLGRFPDLETKYQVTDDAGNVSGAVLSSVEITQLLGMIADGSCVETATHACAPRDTVGHGTHVTGIATSTGVGGRYPGVAPNANIIAVRATRGLSDGIEEDDIVRAAQFIFDRADFEKKPVVVNLSIGSDFGPHDGTLLWEQTLASYVGANFPGRSIVAAAGNSGSIDQPIHQSVHASKGTVMRVPISVGAATSGAVNVWLTMRTGADLKIGLDGPDGQWIAPVPQGQQAGKNTDDYNAGVIYGSNLANSPIPQNSNGAVIVWTGKWPKGPYYVTLDGSGTVDMYLQGVGDASLDSDGAALFTYGVREGTINLPATNPSIIGVGCTVNRPSWVSIGGSTATLHLPVLDGAGGLLTDPLKTRTLAEGEMCWFSSAGPTSAGVPKPEIAAPGANVISAMSRNAKPGVPGSVFTNPSCPTGPDGKQDTRCLQIDATHAIAVGTSMSTPVVAGVVALLLQKDPTLTQDKIVSLLQAGAHHFRGAAPYDDQSGPGEVDAVGALDALDQMSDQTAQMPAADESWITLSDSFVNADGSTAITAIIELRTAGAAHRADYFDRTRLTPTLAVDGSAIDTPDLVRVAPGLYTFTWTPPAGLGGALATFGALFDGAPIVAPRTVPIATDSWNASYPSKASGSGCDVTAVGGGEGGLVALVLAFGAVVLRKRRA